MFSDWENVKEIIKIKNIKVFLLVNSLYSTWFVEAVWFFYWVRFATYTQIGIMFSILTVVWIVAEIPTGVIADKLGRKFAVTLGFLLLFIGDLSIALAQGYWWLFVGGFIANIGRAFISGALEALVYDDLKTKNKEHLFDSLMSFKIRISVLVFAVTVIIGGFLYRYNFRLPNILMATSALFAFIFSLGFREMRINSPDVFNKSKFSESLQGFKELSKVQIRPFLLPSILIMVLYFLYDWGFSKPVMAVNFGFYERGQAIIYSFFAVVDAVAVGWIPFIRKRVSDKNGLIYLSLLVALGFTISSFKLGYIGVLAMIAIELSGVLSEPWISTVINKFIDSAFRATTLSTLQFVSKVPFLVLNVILGLALDGKEANTYHFMLGVSIIIILGVWFLTQKFLVASVRSE